MRVRYFLIILTVLFLVAVGAVAMHTIFMRNEQLALIDQQLRATAEALIDTKVGDLRQIDFDESAKVVSEELGKTHIAKFFVIRNDAGQILFESPIAAEIASIAPIPQDKTWIDLRAQGKFIRVLNLSLPRISDRSVQVGLVLDPELANPSYFSGSAVPFLTCIFAIGLVVSFFLTSFLLAPIARLEEFLRKVSDHAKVHPQLMSVPASLFGKLHLKDEFQRLLFCLNALIERVNSNYRFSRLWAYQMAHELKTPLSIMGLELERIQKRKGLSEADLSPLHRENAKLSDTINTFLDWAELESLNHRRHLFANRIGAIAHTVAESFRHSHPNRIELDFWSDPVVVANPQHLEQTVSNLIMNALSYSEKSVVVRIQNRDFSVIDKGSGIPQSVIDRLGEPFNRGDSGGKGHGLGLAWVKSICRFYSWDLKVNSSSNGTQITICFPDDNESSESSLL